MAVRSAQRRSAHDADGDMHADTWVALRSLPAPLREVLLLREVEGLAMGEVAARLGLPRAAAERRWTQAIVLMTERLAKTKQKHNSRQARR